LPTAEGEEERVLRAAQIVVDEGHGPTHLDWPPCGALPQRIEKFGLRLKEEHGLRRGERRAR
jgi:phosphotransacetylase